MKAKERHHLKQNEFAETAGKVASAAVEHQRSILVGVIVVVVVLATAGGGFWWRKHRADQAGAALAAAVATVESPIAPAPTLPGATQAPGTFTSEKARSEAALMQLQAVIINYPSSDAAQAARFALATQLIALGRFTEAEQTYRDVIAVGGSPIYAPMGRLAVAEVLVAQKKFDEAIKTLTDLSGTTDGTVPVDGVLMQLARAQQQAGKTADARATYKRVVDEFGTSPYADNAKQKLEQLN